MPSENYILLERIELNASAASVTFANIPQTGYTDLKIVVSARGANSNPYCYVSMGFNGVTTNQTARGLNGTASSASSFSTTNFQFFVNGNTSTASTFSNNEFYIPNYAGSTNKSVSLDGVFESNSTSADNNYLQFMADLWSSTAAITSVTFTGVTGSFVAGSTFSLYGIAAVGTTPAIAPKASGGNVIATDGTYWYHAFLSSGNFVPQQNLTCDALVVAGGGGGANGNGGGGGGGAGGFRNASAQSLLSSTNYAITIGAGGAGGQNTGASQPGISGSDSSIIGTGLSYTSSGGGGGASYITPPINGGSGGGAGYAVTSAGGLGNIPTTTPSQGNNGGAGNGAPAYGGGGGGGAGAAGSNGTTAAGGAGGAGSNSYSSWSSATNTGVSGYYAGGGGGATNSGSYSAGTGGAGGAGNGGAGNVGTAAIINTGSGGGGGGSAYAAGGAGSSGIVIIRYPAA